MMLRLAGAGLLCLGSVSVGFSAAAAVRKGAKELQQLKLALEMMHCEVSYALKPIGAVCEIISRSCTGDVAKCFTSVRSLYAQTYSQPEKRVAQTVAVSMKRVPKSVRDSLTELLTSFGKFGASEQLRMIDLTTEKVDAAISQVNAEQAQRCKCYRTLGICTGLAAAVLVF